jgi:hypothetical protein
MRVLLAPKRARKIGASVSHTRTTKRATELVAAIINGTMESECTSCRGEGLCMCGHCLDLGWLEPNSFAKESGGTWATSEFETPRKAGLLLAPRQQPQQTSSPQTEAAADLEPLSPLQFSLPALPSNNNPPEEPLPSLVDALQLLLPSLGQDAGRSSLKVAKPRFAEKPAPNLALPCCSRRFCCRRKVHHICAPRSKPRP